MDECAQAWADRGVDATKHGFDGLLRLVRQEVLERIQLADFYPPAGMAQGRLCRRSGPSAAMGSSSPASSALQPPGCSTHR
jgi:hypothetical protein